MEISCLLIFIRVINLKLTRNLHLKLVSIQAINLQVVMLKLLDGLKHLIFVVKLAAIKKQHFSEHKAPIQYFQKIKF